MNTGNTVLALDSKSIDSLLHRLVAEQGKELQEKAFQPVSFDRRKPVLKEFQITDGFSSVYDKARTFYLVPHTDTELAKFRVDFAGMLFEQLAYSFLSGKLFPDRVVISPERALNFYTGLFPENPVAKTDTRSDSIHGTVVPDGMVTQCRDGVEQVVMVCEYTLYGHPDYFKNKLDGFNAVKTGFPRTFKYASLLFVVPYGAYLPISIKHHPNVHVEQIPFSHGQFRDFVDRAYEHYRRNGDDDATLSEIQKEVRFQRKRAMKRFHEGSLTPEMALYLKKVDPGSMINRHHPNILRFNPIESNPNN